MEYKLLVLASEVQLAALNFSDLDAPDYVSIDGNSTLEYTGPESVDLFVQYVKEYFNIDTFSDIDIKIILLEFDLSRSERRALYAALESAESISVVDANTILPMLLMKEASVERNTRHNISAFGKTYEIAVDEDCNFQCTPIDTQDKLPEIDAQSYRLLFQFNSAGLSASKKQEERIAQLEADRVSHEESLRKERLSGEEALQKVKRLLAQKEEQIERVEQELKKAKEIMDAVGYRASLDENSSREFYKTSNDKYGYWYRNCEEGEFVAVGDVIGVLSYSDTIRSLVKAKSAGKVFYFCKDGEYISDGGELVAVISDLSDTREKIIQWHKRKTGVTLLEKL